MPDGALARALLAEVSGGLVRLDVGRREILGGGACDVSCGDVVGTDWRIRSEGEWLECEAGWGWG